MAKEIEIQLRKQLTMHSATHWSRSTGRPVEANDVCSIRNVCCGLCFFRYFFHFLQRWFLMQHHGKAPLRHSQCGPNKWINRRMNKRKYIEPTQRRLIRPGAMIHSCPWHLVCFPPRTSYIIRVKIVFATCFSLVACTAIRDCVYHRSSKGNCGASTSSQDHCPAVVVGTSQRTITKTRLYPIREIAGSRGVPLSNWRGGSRE